MEMEEELKKMQRTILELKESKVDLQIQIISLREREAKFEEVVAEYSKVTSDALAGLRVVIHATSEKMDEMFKLLKGY